MTNGLDQGDPISGICYLIYNVDILRITKTKDSERSLLYMDDILILATGKDFHETHNKIRNIMNRTDGIFTWAKTHNCEFGIDKFQLLNISRKMIPHTLNLKKRVQLPWRALMLGNHCIPSAETAKFLGVVVNNKLNWKAQGATALAKGQSWIIQFTRMTRVSHGTTARYIHKLYLTIAVPRMLYAADIFLTPQKKGGIRTDKDRPNQVIVNKLASIQRQVAIMITGAMRTTATDILNIMAGLLPFRTLIDKH